MALLRTFAVLSLAGSVVLSLLPPGLMRRTAAMAIGLLTLLCWMQGLLSFFDVEAAALLPATVLAPTGYQLEETE